MPFDASGTLGRFVLVNPAVPFEIGHAGFARSLRNNTVGFLLGRAAPFGRELGRVGCDALTVCGRIVTLVHATVFTTTAIGGRGGEVSLDQQLRISIGEGEGEEGEGDELTEVQLHTRRVSVGQE